MARSFGEAFATDPAPRILPLEITRGYRDAATESRDVRSTRHLACASCARKGCESCSFVGWTIDEHVITVVVPHGAGPGARIDVDGAPGVVVELVEAGPRADVLRAAVADYEGKLSTAWSMDRAARRGRQRRWQAGGVALVMLLIGGGLAHWLTKPAAGEACTSDDDCRSSHCVRLETLTQSSVPRVDGRVCTAACMTDLDCPMLMHCTEERALSGGHQVVANAPPGRACMPNGY